MKIKLNVILLENINDSYTAFDIISAHGYNKVKPYFTSTESKARHNLITNKLKIQSSPVNSITEFIKDGRTYIFNGLKHNKVRLCDITRFI